MINNFGFGSDSFFQSVSFWGLGLVWILFGLVELIPVLSETRSVAVLCSAAYVNVGLLVESPVALKKQKQGIIMRILMRLHSQPHAPTKGQRDQTLMKGPLFIWLSTCLMQDVFPEHWESSAS